MLNTSATTVGSCLLLMLMLVLLQLGVALPWWHRNDAGYDASLDPVAWSRAFVQDQVRKPRISQPMQLPQLEQHRRSWWSSSRSHNRNSNNNNSSSSSSSGSKKKRNNYKKFVRRHRKRRLMLRQTRC
ncbi:hypothetical protein AWZ03_002775 [Drosophila navojoa]|uniref:Uncharacterized protein n=1 Tax=Drosophila navojoa TaxID=7232 RepID=A0A484BPL2_DRONA|nr:hypothetical protein AWZ03_002775 [Drosophila navojoa]